MAKEKKVRIQVCINKQLLGTLDKIAESSDMSRSSIIEVALFHLIKDALVQGSKTEKKVETNNEKETKN